MSVTTPTPRSGRGWWKIIVVLLIVGAVAAATASIALRPVTGWYASLHKPTFSPPAWVVVAVSAAQCGLMVVAAWRVWEAPAAAAEKRGAFAHFAIQLTLGALWMLMFFGLQRPVSGLILVLALLAAVASTARRFYLIDRLAGLVLIPYVAWVAFVTVLSAAIVGLNP